MRRRAVPGITPLLEQAKLTRIVCCRRSHARGAARPPFLAWLLIHIDDMHRFPNEFIASKGSLRQQAHQDVRIAPRRGGGEDTHGTAGVILLLCMRRRRKRAHTQRNRQVQNATPHTALTSRLGLAPDIVGQTSRSLASCASGVTGVHRITDLLSRRSEYSWWRS